MNQPRIADCCYRRLILRASLLLVCIALLISCRVYRVLPFAPSYILRSPDRHNTPLPDVLRDYNGFEPGLGSMVLRPQMEIQIENAYYEKGASRKGLKGFLGTEIARYEITAAGLRLLTVTPMKERPEADLPVERLIAPAQLNLHYFRFYFEIVFARKNNEPRKDDERGSVLLAADSIEELNQLSTRLTNDPEALCGKSSAQCTAFPEACSVSVEMKIVVNGKPQTAVWASALSSIVTDHPRHVDLKRLYGERLTEVKLNPHDTNALRLPLLPGDQITWH